LKRWWDVKTFEMAILTPQISRAAFGVG